MEQKPTIGRIVKYKTTLIEREQLKMNYVTGEYGNGSEELPAIIVAVWSDTTVNVQVFSDNKLGTFWKTSIQKGDQEGQWNFPVIIK